MFKKMLHLFMIFLPLSLSCVNDPISDGVFYCPEYPLIDCSFFTAATLDNHEQQHNAPLYAMPENSAYYQTIYAQYPSHYHYAIASAHRITNSIDARQAQAYARQTAQQHRNALCSISSLPPEFKDSFEKRGVSEKMCAKFFKGSYSKQAYAQAFNQKLVALCGPNYSQQAAACYQRAEMRQWTNYYYNGYKEFIRSLPVYDDYMLEIAHEYKNDKQLAQKLRNTECRACTFITEEEKRILKKREQEAETKKKELLKHYNHQRQEIAHDIFIEQTPLLDQCVTSWEQHNPKRAQAYYQVRDENGACRLAYYDMPTQTHACLRSHGLDPEDYASLHGNALQQELFLEAIDGLKVVATLPNPHSHKPFDSIMHHTTFKIFDSARRVNEMGDCFGASQLIDLATTLIDYSAAAIEGTVEGIIEGAHDGVVGTYHMLRHPIKTVQALGKVAVCIAKMAHDYIPLQGPLWLCTTEQERADYYQRHARIIQNWAEVDQKLERWWRETPTREKIRVMTKGISSAVTNAVVGHQCMQLAGNICKLAAVEAVAICRKVEKVEVAAVGMPPGEMPKMVFNGMSEAEQIAETPATTLLNEIQSIHQSAGPLTTFTESAFEEAVAYAMDPNKIEHIFKKPMHNLEQLVAKLGGQENTIRAVLDGLKGKVSFNQIFEDIKINVAGYEVYVRGRIMDGIPKIGTFFIK